MLALRDTVKTYGELRALDGVSMAFDRATTTALIGPSGCGKSTALRVLMGLIEPDSGAAEFDGQAITRANVREICKRIGYVIQSGGLFPHMTARRNVAFPAVRAGVAKAEINHRIERLAAMTHLAPEMLARHPAELSGGQRQRVSLMRALILEPEALLLDEPLGALDPVIRGELQHELRELFAELGKTVVLVTHDLAEAAYLAHDIVLMRRGHVVQRGPLEDLARNPADEFVTRFVHAQRERVEALLEVAT